MWSMLVWIFPVGCHQVMWPTHRPILHQHHQAWLCVCWKPVMDWMTMCKLRHAAWMSDFFDCPSSQAHRPYAYPLVPSPSWPRMHESHTLSLWSYSQELLSLATFPTNESKVSALCYNVTRHLRWIRCPYLSLFPISQPLPGGQYETVATPSQDSIVRWMMWLCLHRFLFCVP